MNREEILAYIGYDKNKERNRLERAAYLVIMGHIQFKGIEAGNLRIYCVISQSGKQIYRVYVGDDIYPTCTCRDWGLNDWTDAYLGIPKPTYRCKHALGVLLWEAIHEIDGKPRKGVLQIALNVPSK